jgi:hypothetical protein
LFDEVVMCRQFEMEELGRRWRGVVEVRSIATMARPLNYLFPLAQNRSALPLWATRAHGKAGDSNFDIHPQHHHVGHGTLLQHLAS